MSAMVPAGYMAKRVVTRPDWLGASSVSSIYSVSGCVSDNFADYITFWKHNGYWLFDSPAVITDIAQENNIDLAETMLFFYEVYELQFNSGEWTSFEQARALLENGTFNNSEPGPYRIFAVYSVAWPGGV